MCYSLETLEAVTTATVPWAGTLQTTSGGQEPPNKEGPDPTRSQRQGEEPAPEEKRQLPAALLPDSDDHSGEEERKRTQVPTVDPPVGSGKTSGFIPTMRRG